jgi:DNA-binding CsgD family transcriptional regulator
MTRRRPVTKRRRLSKRQTQVLRALAAGVAPEEIAADLGVQIATIRVFRYYIRRKTRRKSAAGQLDYAIRHNLLNPLAGPPAGLAGDVTAPTAADDPSAETDASIS